MIWQYSYCEFDAVLAAGTTWVTWSSGCGTRSCTRQTGRAARPRTPSPPASRPPSCCRRARPTATSTASVRCAPSWRPLRWATGGPASLGSAPGGAASLGSVPAGPVSLGSVPASPASLGSAPAGPASLGLAPGGPASLGSVPAGPASLVLAPAGPNSLGSTPLIFLSLFWLLISSNLVLCVLDVSVLVSVWSSGVWTLWQGFSLLERQQPQSVFSVKVSSPYGHLSVGLLRRLLSRSSGPFASLLRSLRPSLSVSWILKIICSLWSALFSVDSSWCRRLLSGQHYSLLTPHDAVVFSLVSIILCWLLMMPSSSLWSALFSVDSSWCRRLLSGQHYSLLTPHDAVVFSLVSIILCWLLMMPSSSLWSALFSVDSSWCRRLLSGQHYSLLTPHDAVVFSLVSIILCWLLMMPSSSLWS